MPVPQTSLSLISKSFSFPTSYPHLTLVPYILTSDHFSFLAKGMTKCTFWNSVYWDFPSLPSFWLFPEQTLTIVTAHFQFVDVCQSNPPFKKLIFLLSFDLMRTSAPSVMAIRVTAIRVSQGKDSCVITVDSMGIWVICSYFAFRSCSCLILEVLFLLYWIFDWDWCWASIIIPWCTW